VGIDGNKLSLVIIIIIIEDIIDYRLLSLLLLLSFSNRFFSGGLKIFALHLIYNTFCFMCSNLLSYSGCECL